MQLTAAAVSEHAVSARRELAGEALVYFQIDPSKSPHLALLNDVVPHPQRPDVPVLITPWASESLHEWLYARDGCGQHGCDQRRQAGTSGELLRCGRCRVALYCCREHQAADWKARHQRECGFARRAGMRETLEIAKRTVRGLKSLHVEHKLVHQDLKPGNILRFGDVRVAGVTSGLFKLGDFGLCARAAAGEQEDDAEADDETEDEADDEVDDKSNDEAMMRQRMKPMMR